MMKTMSAGTIPSCLATNCLQVWPAWGRGRGATQGVQLTLGDDDESSLMTMMMMMMPMFLQGGSAVERWIGCSRHRGFPAKALWQGEGWRSCQLTPGDDDDDDDLIMIMMTCAFITMPWRQGCKCGLPPSEEDEIYDEDSVPQMRWRWLKIMMKMVMAVCQMRWRWHAGARRGSGACDQVRGVCRGRGRGQGGRQDHQLSDVRMVIIAVMIYI